MNERRRIAAELERARELVAELEAALEDDASTDAARAIGDELRSAARGGTTVRGRAIADRIMERHERAVANRPEEG